MSYILEALKKSEQERERGNVPDIKSIHSNESDATDDKKHHWWPYLLVLVLLVNGVIFAVVFVGQETSESIDQVENKADATSSNTKDQSVPDLAANQANEVTAPSPKQSEAVPAPEKPKPAVQEKPQPKVIFSKEPLDMSGDVDVAQGSTSASTQKISGTDDNEDATQQEAMRAQLISELPDSVRQSIPSIEFAGHVYSSSKERRSVMINGKKMREGEAVSPNLFLHAITPEGAEFDYQGYRFKLNALQDWSNR